MVFQLIKNSSGSKSSILNEETKVNHQPPLQQSLGQQFHHSHHQHQQTSAPPSLHHSHHQQPLQGQQQNNHPQMFVQQPGYQQPQEQPPHTAQFNHHQTYNQYPSQSHPLPASQQQPYGYYPPLPPQQQQHLQQNQPQDQQQNQQHPHSTPYLQHPPALLLPHANPGAVQLGQHQHQQQSQSQYRAPLSLLTRSRTTSYFDQNGTISLPPLNANGGDLEQNQLQRSRHRDSTKRHTIHGSDLSLLSKFRVEDGLKSSSFNEFASDLLAFNHISSSSSQQQSSSSPPPQPPLQPQSSKQQFSPHMVHNPQPIYHAQPIHPVVHISPQQQQQPAPSSRQQQSHPTTQQQSPSTGQAAPVKQPKKYTCHCKRSFTTSGHLARHMRIHTGEKNYECPYDGCSARFSRQDNCMQHYRTHLGGRSRGSSSSSSTNSSTNNLSSNGRNSTSNRSRKSSSATLQNPANPKE
ncbi:similar to Saccharomyces cerevisiae YDR043C NRG1 Transcriptional repressor that recruits the Cyc8p-Tup1p complex to promoters [Geotrichum candidum]|uniref:Similar to Saccharomyces cerevisiae YDR043C NRG1 Transcriptional repressor that recruits the Cyc8p-Tup1p complex to promoters n=1 Tax=Geotrichum candidum TaxID=1173061 RepID=A0A0J9X855_GEOCN|nr:similar to Saccharomyces cerevisiae YDR043C NRG1 Transcriptional repressor that recruits the Cyc8p-Tup1p complex to promoters [Geotrichum candidum]